ncbi:hypothetical protein I2486_16115 [Cellulophaga sp. E16_2]|uniref:hypothetical protein n=1 Tax=Cellulophaga sp. E16_2 TaxID=2789297 RepID=UPI001A938B54|nr:hypothetical protein [Cellulophaga sp. E16_2]MBO0592930.1 hypothetical protein [Cellulophaga sp. E16_2]
MENHNNNPHKSQVKDKQLKPQKRLVLDALREKSMTMKELDIHTGVMRENICRYVSELIQMGLIAIRRKRKCSVTGHSNVNEYTGNPDLFPKCNQLNLF